MSDEDDVRGGAVTRSASSQRGGPPDGRSRRSGDPRFHPARGARALAGPIEEFLAQGIVPSAEALAELVPQIAATTTAMVYPDEALRTLMTANDVAFRNRRSLLLLDLQHRVRLEELPWVRAAAAFRDDSDHAQRSARSALVRLASWRSTDSRDDPAKPADP